MNAKIIQIGDIQPNLMVLVDYEIVEDDKVLATMQRECMPSEAELLISNSLRNFKDEYDMLQKLKVGQEIV